MAFPVVESRATSGQDSNSLSHTVTMPSGVTVGDLLIAFVAVDGNPTVSDGSGTWTKLGQAIQTTIVTGAVFYKTAAGSDSLTLTTTATEHSSHITLRISGAGTPTGTSAVGQSTNSNPPSHAPGGGAQDYLWVAFRAGDDTTVATVAPSSYANLQTRAGASSLGASANTAERDLNASSEDPGTFTAAAEQWVCWTVSIPGAAAPFLPPPPVRVTQAALVTSHYW